MKKNRVSGSIRGVLLGTVLAAASLGVPASAEDFSMEEAPVVLQKGSYTEEAVSAAGEDTDSLLKPERTAEIEGTENTDGQTDSQPDEGSGTVPVQGNQAEEDSVTLPADESQAEADSGTMPVQGSTAEESAGEADGAVPSEESADVQENADPIEAIEGTDEMLSGESAAEKPAALTEDGLPAAKDLTYTGEPQELLDAAGAEEGAFLYSMDGETYDSRIPTGIDAGEYTVYVKAAATFEPENAANPETEAAAVTVTIKKADVIFTAPVPIA